jgi:chloramphenicol 3-O-phosphotransferase
MAPGADMGALIRTSWTWRGRPGTGNPEHLDYDRARMDPVPGRVGARYVVVSGPPASGKTLLAHAIADDLDWPLIAKDSIKAALTSVASPHDVEGAKQVGRTALVVLLAVADDVRGGAVLEAVWRHDQCRHRMSDLPGWVVEVFCRCDLSVLEARYAARVRPPGYVPEHQYPSELWSPETFTPLGLGWPVVEVDTTAEVDLAAVLAAIRQKLDRALL